MNSSNLHLHHLPQPLPMADDDEDAPRVFIKSTRRIPHSAYLLSISVSEADAKQLRELLIRGFSEQIHFLRMQNASVPGRVKARISVVSQSDAQAIIRTVMTVIPDVVCGTVSCIAQKSLH